MRDLMLEYNGVLGLILYQNSIDRCRYFNPSSVSDMFRGWIVSCYDRATGNVSYRPRRAHLRGNGDVIGGLVHDARYSLPYLHSPLKVGVCGSAVSSPGRVRIRMHFCAISAQKWPLVALKSGRGGTRTPRAR